MNTFLILYYSVCIDFVVILVGFMEECFFYSLMGSSPVSSTKEILNNLIDR